MSGADDFLLRGRKVAAALAFVAIAFASGWSLIFPKKPIPLSRADGIYANSQCGAIELHNGVASWGAMKASYTLDTDKEGMFALTDYFVGVKTEGQACSLASDRSKYPLKLRFDDSERPTVVTLWDRDQPATVNFSRQATWPKGG